MKKLLFSVLFFLSINTINAQTVRPGVLVVGNTGASVAAAIQSAQSGVKTILLLQAGAFDVSPIINNLSSGIEAKFLEKVKSQPDFKTSANAVLTKWTDTLKNLTVIKNTQYEKADRSGKNWVFKLTDGRTIRPKVLIMANDPKLLKVLKLQQIWTSWAKLSYKSTIYRTSVVARGAANYIALFQLIDPLEENLLHLYEPQSMLLGQATGAVAAYAAFFDKKTSESNLKTIQGELINYKLNLMPFADVKVTDTNWKAIQFVGLTGVLNADLANGTANFNPEKLVTTAEVKEPIKSYFYKAQLFFDDYKKDIMTIGATIDLVCYVGNKSPESTKKTIAKNWNTKYGFSATLDYNRQISRREFAVLLQDYMSPFNVNIDKQGVVAR
jgi:hypothetical protein